jgi:hypothetical protein
MNFGGAGLTGQLTAIGSYTHPGHAPETKDITDQVSWLSSASQCVTVNNTGLITTGGNVCSNILVTASAPGFNGDITGSMTVNVTQPTGGNPNGDVTSIAIIPTTQTVASLNQTTQFVAIGSISGSASVNLTTLAVWNSSDRSIASITAGGLATALAPGTTTISAIYTNPDGTVADGTATFTVAPPSGTGSTEPLVSLAVIPTSQTVLAANQTAQFIAIGTTGTGTTVNLTNTATWTSSSPSIATINANGLATSLSSGTAAMTAIATNPDGTVVSGSGTLTVQIPATSGTEQYTSLAILPTAQTALAVGQTSQYIAIATTGTGTTVDVTNTATWISSNTGIGTIGKNTGLATAVSNGTTAITAEIANNDGSVVTGSATFTVTVPANTEPFTSLAVIPANQTLLLPGQTAQFIAIGSTSSGSTEDLTGQVVWNSSSAQIATIVANSGLATAVGQGSVTITALYSSGGTTVSGTGTLSVTGGTVEQYTGLTITPTQQALSASGQTGQFIALATTGNGQVVDVTSSPNIVWKSSAPSIATVSTTGLAAGVSAGTSTVTAELSNPDTTVVSANATVTVSLTPPVEPILSLQVIPASITVTDFQLTGQFLAIATYSTAPYVRDVTNAPTTTWLSSEPEIFPVGTNTGGSPGASAGLVTSDGSGSATIIAESSSSDGTIQTATATFACPYNLASPPQPSTCYPGEPVLPTLLETLTFYNEGLNTTDWQVTAPSATGTPDVLHCGPGWTLNGGPGGSVCTATYPEGSTVLITAPAGAGAFGGWSYNCVPSDETGAALPGPVFWTAGGPNYCVVTLSTNDTVGGIFN